MPTIAEANWDRWEAGVRAEGVLQGRVSLISRQAALRFGVQTAERLSVLLNSLAEREELQQVGDWIIECGSVAHGRRHPPNPPGRQTAH